MTLAVPWKVRRRGDHGRGQPRRGAEDRFSDRGRRRTDMPTWWIPATSWSLTRTIGCCGRSGISPVSTQVKSARADRSASTTSAPVAVVADGLGGGQVLAAHAAIAPLGWFVFVERPAAAAYAPLRAPIIRSAVIFVLGLGLSVLASILLARRMVAPIRVLQEGAARIGAGRLDQPIEAAHGRRDPRPRGIVQPHDGKPQGVLRGPGAEGGGAHARSCGSQPRPHRGPRAADGDQRDPARSSVSRRRTSSPCWTRWSRAPRDFAGPMTRSFFSPKGTACGSTAHHGADSQARRDFWCRWCAERSRDARYSSGGPFMWPTFRPRWRSSQKAARLARRLGLRTTLSVPLVRESAAIGVIQLRRTEVNPFSDKQIALLKTFADQAVIAIENVRLFKELQERTQELTRSVEELRALGEVGQAVSSSLDVQSVLTSIVSHAVELSQTDAGTIYEFDEATQVFVPRANSRHDRGIDRGASPVAYRHRHRRAGSARRRRRAPPSRSPTSRASRTTRCLSCSKRDTVRSPRGPAPARGPRDRRAGGPAEGRGDVPDADRGPAPDLRDPVGHRHPECAAASGRSTRRAGRSKKALAQPGAALPPLDGAPGAAVPRRAAHARPRRRAPGGRPRPHLRLDARSRCRRGSWSPPQAGLRASSDWQDLVGRDDAPSARRERWPPSAETACRCCFTEDAPAAGAVPPAPPYSALAGLRVKSFLVIPMIARGRAVGVLAADNRAKPRRRFPAHTRRPAPGLRRPGGRRRRERPSVPGDPGEEPAARAREQAQVAVPRQHEPRAAHTDARRAGLYRPHPGRHLRRRAAADSRDARAGQDQRAAPPGPDQRRARPLQDRGGAAHAFARRLRHGGRRPRGRLRGAVPRRREEARPQRRSFRTICRGAAATSAGSPRCC